MLKNVKNTLFEAWQAFSEATREELEISRRKKNSNNFNYESLQKQVVTDLKFEFGLKEKQAVNIFESSYLLHKNRDNIIEHASYLGAIVRFSLDNN